MKTVTEFVNSLAPRSPLAFGALRREVEARDAEHRAELDAAQATIEQLGKDAAALAGDNDAMSRRFMAKCADFDALAKEFAKANGAIDGQLMENERLKGELAEARSIVYDLVLYAQKAPGAAQTCHRARVFLAAPPPAESTPVQQMCTMPICRWYGDNHGGPHRMPEPAPPDDIRERLERVVEQLRKEVWADALDLRERLDALDEFVRKLAQDSATQGAVVTLENKVAALEAKDSDRCARADCGRPRRWGGHEGHHEFVAALEAKGEPGTHARPMACGECGEALCNCACEPKGAKP